MDTPTQKIIKHLDVINLLINVFCKYAFFKSDELRLKSQLSTLLKTMLVSINALPCGQVLRLQIHCEVDRAENKLISVNIVGFSFVILAPRRSGLRYVSVDLKYIDAPPLECQQKVGRALRPHKKPELKKASYCGEEFYVEASGPQTPPGMLTCDNTLLSAYGLGYEPWKHG